MEIETNQHMDRGEKLNSFAKVIMHLSLGKVEEGRGKRRDSVILTRLSLNDTDPNKTLFMRIYVWRKQYTKFQFREHKM